MRTKALGRDDPGDQDGQVIVLQPGGKLDF